MSKHPMAQGWIDWQPISTAPKDEAVLIGGGDIQYPIVASWSGLSDEVFCLDAQGDTHDEIEGWPTHWARVEGPK